MKKMWQAILAFFGLSGAKKDNKADLQTLMNWINSQERIDQSTKSAYQAIQKRDTLQSGRTHPYEGIILTDCLTVDSALTQYQSDKLTNYFSDASYLTQTIENGIGTELTNFQATRVQQLVSADIAQAEPLVKRIRNDLKDIENELRIFKGANGLQRPVIETAKENTKLLLWAFVIIEAFTNMLFLRSAFEPTKGLFIASIIAGINVLGNVYFGNRYREKNNIDPEKAKKGRREFYYALILITVTNALIAFARFYAATVAGNSADMGFVIESIVLVGVGYGFGIMAFNKGYSMDDPYPGYGELSRRTADLRAQFDDITTQHAQSCEKLKSQAISGHESIKLRINSASLSLSKSTPEMARAIEDWKNKRAQINQAYAQLQQVFKAVMINNSTLGDEYPSEIKNLSENPLLNQNEKQLEKFKNNKEEVVNKVNELIEQIDKSAEELHMWLKSDEAKILWSWPN